MMLEISLSIDYLSLQILVNSQTNVYFFCEATFIILVLKWFIVFFQTIWEPVSPKKRLFLHLIRDADDFFYKEMLINL